MLKAPAAFAATQFSVGRAHSCAVTEAGGARCWGFNSNGQLGTGDTATASSAVDVSSLTSGVAAVGVGSQHSCALTTSGGVKCWGFNFSGQLGDGTTTQRLTPVDVSGLTSGVASISVGLQHSCAVTTGGALKCWGDNGSGQLGSGGGDSNVPVDVSGLTSGVASVSAGSAHTCARTTSGTAKCWGRNDDGRLGDGSTTNRTTPVDVSGLTSGVAVIDAGLEHTCAVTTAGAAKCWGENDSGQLGTGNTTDSNVPVDVSGLGSGVAGISGGGNLGNFSHTCAVLTNGTVKCWGTNGSGQLGNGTTTASNSPVDVSGIASGATLVDTGADHSCARLSSGELLCWGSDSLGILGNGGANQNSSTPVAVAGLKSPQTITFVAPSDKTFGDAAFNVTASASSGLAVTLASTTTSVCTVASFTITLAGAGTCGITASQAGNASFDPAPDVSRSFNVAKAAQNITFNALGDKTLGDAAFDISASASSGLAVSFASQTAATCSVSGTTVTLAAAGTCTVAANQAGNNNFLAATQVARSFNIAAPNAQAQTITFAALPNRRIGSSPFTLSASSSSGLPVSYASSTPSICTVSASTVSLVARGTCTIEASQAGSASFLAATPVSQSFVVTRSGGGGGCAAGTSGNDMTLLLLGLLAFGRALVRKR